MPRSKNSIITLGAGVGNMNTNYLAATNYYEIESTDLVDDAP